MNCKKTLLHLNRYLDGELSNRENDEVEDHLRDCEACRKQFDTLRSVVGMLEVISVPPVPDGLASRVMAKAQKRQSFPGRKRNAIWPLQWRPGQWFMAASMPMRLAACGLIVLACILGISMSQEVFVSQKAQAGVELSELKWFDPVVPGSVGSAYLTVTFTSLERGVRP
jgi:anti-sigma factor RsiW